MWLGKFLVGVLGYLYAGFWGAILGIFIGNIIDQKFGHLINQGVRGNQQAVEEVFFATVFGLLGKLAKSDGQISRQEINHTEGLMSSMGLTSEHRREAIRLFQEGARPDFTIDACIYRFNEACGRRLNLKTMLLNYLVSLALADGELASGEEALLYDIARKLGFPDAVFDRFIAMIRAQAQFKADNGRGFQGSSVNEIMMAYQALGIDSSATDAEVKKAYRKLMSQNHPDKLMGQGVPEDMIKLATERSQEIQTAYDVIVSHRKRQQ